MIRKTTTVLTLVVLFAFLCFASQVLCKKPKVHILDPVPKRNYQVYQKNAARWWQWAMGNGPVCNPMTDTDGSCCHVGQKGKVWFLSGFSPFALRKCTVPYGKSIFFPIINVENLGIETCDLIKNVPGLVKGTDHYNLACVIVSMNLVESLSLEINGKKFNKEDLTRHRVISKKYKVTPAEGNIFGHPSVRTIARADGWWVMLENLKPGVYHIEFSGEIPNIFKLRTKYILTVAKKK